MLKNPAIPIFAGLLGLLTIWYALIADGTSFIDNMLPELIGFCLEGIFFIGIFTWLQERRDSARKNELRQSLAGAMGFICQVINSSFAPADQVRLPENDNWIRQARTNGRYLNELLARLSNAELVVTPDTTLAMQQLLQTRLSTLDSLLSVSAQLSHSHLSAYNLILTEVHKIARHPFYDAASLKQAFISLLRLLISFNNEKV